MYMRCGFGYMSGYQPRSSEQNDFSLVEFDGQPVTAHKQALIEKPLLEIGWYRPYGFRCLTEVFMYQNLPTYELGEAGPQRELLNSLAISGKKKCTVGLLQQYKDENKNISEVGNIFTLLGSDDEPMAVITIQKVSVCKFSDVSEQILEDEGESTVSIKKWREEHKAFFKQYGYTISKDSEMVVEWFTTKGSI